MGRRDLQMNRRPVMPRKPEKKFIVEPPKPRRKTAKPGQTLPDRKKEAARRAARKKVELADEDAE